jgi:hypothetical protein
MFSGVVADLARERASMLRDIELITESTKDAQLQEAIMIYENCDKDHRLYTEDNLIPPDEREEIKQAIEQIPDDDTDAPEQIARIMNSENDEMNVDQMLGITGPDEDPAPDVLAGLRATEKETEDDEVNELEKEAI